MKFSTISVLATLLAAASAVTAPQRQVIVSYPDDTPNSVVDAAMNEIKSAGGFVTHEYKIFKGFAAQASENMLEKVKALGAEYMPFIEEDQIVSIPEDGPQ